MAIEENQKAVPVFCNDGALSLPGIRLLFRGIVQPIAYEREVLPEKGQLRIARIQILIKANIWPILSAGCGNGEQKARSESGYSCCAE
jgi:hypothetical protein